MITRINTGRCCICLTECYSTILDAYVLAIVERSRVLQLNHCVAPLHLCGCGGIRAGLLQIYAVDGDIVGALDNKYTIRCGCGTYKCREEWIGTGPAFLDGKC